jgi:polyvinyl alcohol dehydrogenase (cytochrome)
VGSSLALVLCGCDPSSLYGPLKGNWTYQTGGVIAAKPAVSNGTAYVGSWDGNEYALDEASGALRWSSFLGLAQAVCSDPEDRGITSSPWIQDGVAYLGGGGSTWDALDTSTGDILWTVPTGDPSATGGHYNWSSPAVYNGYAYVGISSYADCPLVQGELLRVNLATHQIDNVFKVVPDGAIGGSIWTSPVVDPSTNTVFVATGNGDPDNPNEPYAQSVIALDATTLAVKSTWPLPAAQDVGDSDFATTPVLFTNSTGRALVAVSNKNGILYAFDRSDVGAGPVWEVPITVPDNECLLSYCGGSFSTGVFDGTHLDYAAALTTVGGGLAGGSLRAIDPDTGAFVWEDALPTQIYGALAQANGMVAVPSYDGGLYLVRASDGTVLYANGLNSGIYGPPTIADGSLFIGTNDGVIHAFSLPSSAGAAVAHAASVARAPCAGARRGGSLTASCRLTVPARTHCVRVGELPSVLGTVVLDRVAIHASGGARARSGVRLYLNGSCAGPPRWGIGVARGHGTLRFPHPTVLAPGTVASVSASRPLQLQLKLTGHEAAKMTP